LGINFSFSALFLTITVAAGTVLGGDMDHIELRVQASYTVVLKGLGTAGYRWSASVDNPKVVRVEHVTAVQRTRERPYGGNSRDEQFKLTGLAPGETIVHFSQARSFEPKKPPHATYNIEVHVT
jgi:predicted secreted protein